MIAELSQSSCLDVFYSAVQTDSTTTLSNALSALLVLVDDSLNPPSP